MLVLSQVPKLTATPQDKYLFFSSFFGREGATQDAEGIGVSSNGWFIFDAANLGCTISIGILREESVQLAGTLLQMAFNAIHQQDCACLPVNVCGHQSKGRGCRRFCGKFTCPQRDAKRRTDHERSIRFDGDS